MRQELFCLLKSKETLPAILFGLILWLVVFGIAGLSLASGHIEIPSHDGEPWASVLGTEIVFVDPGVLDFETLLWGVEKNMEVVILDGRSPGIVQIADALKKRRNVMALYIISHGVSGELVFKGGDLSLENLSHYKGALQEIARAMGPGGDILLYGCNVAKGRRGNVFIAAVAELTSADVAASNDPTGSYGFGGDWDLEASIGSVKERLFAELTELDAYRGLLAIESFSTNPTSEVSNGSTTDPNFSKTIDTDTFTFDFSGGDGGGFIHLSTWGETGGGDQSLAIKSAVVNAGTTETASITAGNGNFVFTSVWVDNAAGGVTESVTVGWYLGGGLVSSQVINANTTATVNAGGATVDEVRFTSNDFRLAAIDNLTVTAVPNTAPTVSVLNGAYTENAAVTLIDGSATASDADGDSAWDTGAKLEVQITANNESNDEISIDVSGDFSISIPDLSYSGVGVIGTISESSGTSNDGVVNSGNKLTVNFSANATNTIVQNLVRAIAYRSTSDAPTASNSTRTVTFTLTDRGIATGSDTSVVTVTAVNDSPTVATNTGASLNEGATHTISNTELNEGDPDDSGTGLTYTVTSSVSYGTLFVDANSNGTADDVSEIITDTETFTQDDIDNNRLKYTHDGTETTADSFTFNLADGGEDLASPVTGQTFNFSISNINDVPTLTNLNGDSLSYSEGDGAVVIDQGTAVSVSDSDSSDLNGGAVTVTISAGEDAAEDRLSLETSGPVSLSGTTSGSDVSVSGTAIGTLGNTIAVGADLVVNLNGSSTATNVAVLMAAVTYEDTDTGNPTTGARTIDFTLSDGDGGTSATASTTVTVSSTNDAPTLTNLNGDSLSYSEGDGAVVIDQGTAVLVSDSDSSDFNGGAVTVTISAGEDAAEDRLSLETSGPVSLSGTTSGSDVSVSGTAIGTLGNTIAVGADLVVNLNGSSTATNVAVLMAAVTYEDTDTGNPTTGARTIDFTLSDGDGGTSATASTTVTVSSTNDAPTLTNLNGDSLSYSEGDGAVVIDQGTVVSVSDSDSSDFNGGAVTVTISAGEDAAEDRLSLETSGPVSLSGTTSGSDVSVSGTAIGTLGNTIAVGADLVVNLNGSSTATNVAVLMAAVTYEDTDTGNPTTGARTIDFTLSDGDGGTSATASTTVTVSSANDPPSIATNTGSSLNEGATDVITNTELNEGDPDDSGTGLTYTVTSTVNNGTLFVDANSNDTADDASEIIIDGEVFTQSDIDNSLLKYTHGGGETTTDSFVFSLADGGENSSSPVINQTFSFTISPLNDSPSIATNTGSALNEGATDVITSTELNEGDPDDSGTGLTYTVTTTTANGTLWVDSDDNGSINAAESAIGNNGTFTQADIDNTLLKYTHDGGETTADSFVFSLADGGEDGSSAVAGQTFNFAISGANDDPNISALPSDIMVMEDTASNVDLSAATFSDVDSGANDVSLVITASSGTLTASSGGSVTVGGSGSDTLTLTGTASNIDTYLNTASNIKYTGASNINGDDADTLTLTGNDGGNTGSGGGGDVALGTVNVDITAVNDDPAISGLPTDITVEENAASNVDLSAATFSDADSGASDVTLTITAGSGTLTASSSGGVAISGSGTGTLTLGGTASKIDTYLNTASNVQYTGALNVTGNDADTLTLTGNDGGNTGSGGGGDVALGTVNVDITAVNDDPAISGLPTDITVEENAASNVDLSAATFSDADSGASDVTLTIAAGSGTLTASSSGGVAISGSGTGTLTLTGTVSNIDTYLNTASNIQYTGALNAIGNDADTLTLTGNDGGNTGTGGGGDVALGTVKVDISAANQDPAISGLPSEVAVTEDTASNIDLSLATFSDADSGANDVTLTIAAGSGTLAASSGGGVAVGGSGTGTLTLTGMALNIDAYLNAVSNIQYTGASNVAGNNADTLTLTGNDGGNTGLGGGGDVALGTVNVDITAVNDDPTMSGLPAEVTVTEDTASSVNLSAATFGDVDSGANDVTLTIAAGSGTLAASSGDGVSVDGSGTGILTLTGTVSGIDTYLNTASNIQYTGPSDVSGNHADTLTLTANDGGNTGSGGGGNVSLGTVNVDITAVNDAPIVGALYGDTSQVVVGGDRGTIDEGGDAIVYDPDSPDFNGGFLRIDQSGGTANGSFSLDGTNATSGGDGTISSGETVRVEGAVVGTVDAVNDGQGGNSLIIGLNGVATAERIQTLIRNIYYSVASGLGSRYFSFQVDDGDGGTSIPFNFTIAVSTNPPIVMNLDGDTPGGRFDGPAIAFDEGGDTTVTDPDSSSFNGGNLSIVQERGRGDGDFSLDGVTVTSAGGAVISTGDTISVSGTDIGTVTTDGQGGNTLLITFTSTDATPDRIQALIRNIYYSAPTSDTRIFVLTVTDAASDSGSATSAENTVTVSLARNKAPAAADNFISMESDTTHVFSVDEFGFSDADAGDTLQQVRIVSLPVDGALRLSGSDVAASQVIPAADISAGSLTFAAPGSEFYTGFEFQVHDGRDYSSGSFTMMIDVVLPSPPPDDSLDSGDTVPEGDAGINDGDTIENVTIGAGGAATNSGTINNLNNAGTVTGGIVGGDSKNSGILEEVAISEGAVLDNLSGTIWDSDNIGSVYGGTLEGDIMNIGTIAGTSPDGANDPAYAVTIAPGAVVTGGTVTGIVVNSGILADVIIDGDAAVIIEPDGGLQGTITIINGDGDESTIIIPDGAVFPDPLEAGEGSVELTFQSLRAYGEEHGWEVTAQTTGLSVKYVLSSGAVAYEDGRQETVSELPVLPGEYALVDGIVVSEAGVAADTDVTVIIPYSSEHIPPGFMETDLLVLSYDVSGSEWKQISFARADDTHFSVETNFLSAFAVAVNQADYKEAGVSVGEITGTTSEDGRSAMFTLVLTREPLADVLIPLGVSDDTEAVIDTMQVTFTPENYETPRTVTVAGLDDLLVDGDVSYTVVISPAVSGDPDYSGLDPTDLIVVNTDNEVLQLTVPVDGDTDVALTTMLQIAPLDSDDPDFQHIRTRWQISTAPTFEAEELVLDRTGADVLGGQNLPALLLETDSTYFWRTMAFDTTGNASLWSSTGMFTTRAVDDDDIDGNGVPDNREVADTVDLDQDGTSDNAQLDIISLTSALGDVQIGVKAGSGTMAVASATDTDPADITDTLNRPESLEIGLVGFKVLTDTPGDTAEVIFFLSSAVAEDAGWYQYDSMEGWGDLSGYATFDSGRTSATLQLTDGGEGDLDGTANGIIIGLSGPDALATESVPPDDDDSTDSGDGSSGDGGSGDGNSGSGGCFITSALDTGAHMALDIRHLLLLGLAVVFVVSLRRFK